jgi:DNA primase
VIDWVMKAEGVSFRHAVELLRADIAVEPGSALVKTSTVRKLSPPVDREADDAEMLEQVVAYYHDTLKEAPEALRYLEARGLTHPEMIGEFRLGYANRDTRMMRNEQKPPPKGASSTT